MTITDLIKNFRVGMLGVLPSVQVAGIPWRRPDAYDEWDSIASALYNSLVVAVCRWSLPDEEQGPFRLPPYDLLLENYSEYSLIEVNVGSKQSEGVLRVFHALGTTDQPFDTVEWRAVSPSGAPLSERLQTSALADVGLALRRLTAHGLVVDLNVQTET